MTVSPLSKVSTKTPAFFMWVAVTSACSEKAPCLPAAPPTFPAAEHFPWARVKAWPAWSPAGILCWTSALPHLPDNEVFVCAEAIATARTTIAQTQRFLNLIRNLLADCKIFLLHSKEGQNCTPVPLLFDTLKSSPPALWGRGAPPPCPRILRPGWGSGIRSL